MHVLGLKNNLFSVAMLEDLGYDVVFSEGKEFLRHKAKTQVKSIRVHVKNLYKIEVDGYAFLSSKAGKVVSWDTRELWHMILGHLHHGTLKIMQNICIGLPKGALAQRDTCKGCTLGSIPNPPFTIRKVETR